MIGDDEILVEHELLAEAVAGGAGALGGVEREQARLDLGDGEARDGAGELLGEDDAVGGDAGILHRAGVLRVVLTAGGDGVDQVDIGRALGELERLLEGLGEAGGDFATDDQAVDHDFDVVLVLLVERGGFLDQIGLAIDADALEAGLLPLGELFPVLALAAADDRGEEEQAGAFGERQDAVDHLADGLRGDRQAGRRAVWDADARPEQAHVIVDLGDRRDGRARIARRRLLLDRDGGGEALDMIDIGLLHQLEELAGISRERLDIAALALGIDGVEGEARLAGAGQAGDHRQRVARDVDVHALEIMLARAADGNMGKHTGGLTVPVMFRV